MPTEFGAGFLYKLSPDLSLTADGYYELEEGANIRSGVAYSIAKVVHVRAGASSNPMKYYAGFGVHWNNFQFDISSAFHQRLGSSPQFALAYVF